MGMLGGTPLPEAIGLLGGQTPTSSNNLLSSLLAGGSVPVPAPQYQTPIAPPAQYNPQGMVSPWWNAASRQFTFTPQTGLYGGGLGKGGAPAPIRPVSGITGTGPTAPLPYTGISSIPSPYTGERPPETTTVPGAGTGTGSLSTAPTVITGTRPPPEEAPLPGSQYPYNYWETTDTAGQPVTHYEDVWASLPIGQSPAEYALANGVSPERIGDFLYQASSIPGSSPAEVVDRYLNPQKYMTAAELEAERAAQAAWSAYGGIGAY